MSDDSTDGEEIRKGLTSVAHAIMADVFPGRDAMGGTVASLTESVMGMTAALSSIADALKDIADAIKERSNEDE